MRLTGFLSHPVRGHDGNAVRPEVKWANIGKAKQIAHWLEMRFPEVDWFFPHKCELLVERLIARGVSINIILGAFADVAGMQELAVFYDWQGFSEGMILEQDAVYAANKPCAVIEEASEHAEVDIGLTIQEARDSQVEQG